MVGLKAYAPLHHVPTSAPWSFGVRASFVAAGAGPLPTGPAVAPEALRTLVLRCLAGFGPASAADVARFARVPKTPVSEALGASDDAVERLSGPDGAVLSDLPGAPRPAADTPAPPRLMAMWDRSCWPMPTAAG